MLSVLTRVLFHVENPWAQTTSAPAELPFKPASLKENARK
jgi:hypothetical protein